MKPFEIGALAFVALLTAARAILLWRRARVNPFKLTHPLEAAFVVVALVFGLGLVLDHPDLVLLDLGAARWSGAALVLVGVLLFLAALKAFGDSWRVGIDRKTPGKLVTGGVFAWTRNPIFVFMDLYLLGTFVLEGTLLYLVLAVLGVVAIDRHIRREERFLLEHYGEDYSAYRSRVPRYL